jgi:hypothetical protein
MRVVAAVARAEDEGAADLLQRAGPVGGRRVGETGGEGRLAEVEDLFAQGVRPEAGGALLGLEARRVALEAEEVVGFGRGGVAVDVELSLEASGFAKGLRLLDAADANAEGADARVYKLVVDL